MQPVSHSNVSSSLAFIDDSTVSIFVLCDCSESSVSHEMHFAKQFHDRLVNQNYDTTREQKQVDSPIPPPTSLSSLVDLGDLACIPPSILRLPSCLTSTSQSAKTQTSISLGSSSVNVGPLSGNAIRTYKLNLDMLREGNGLLTRLQRSSQNCTGIRHWLDCGQASWKLRGPICSIANTRRNRLQALIAPV